MVAQVQRSRRILTRVVFFSLIKVMSFRLSVYSKKIELLAAINYNNSLDVPEPTSVAFFSKKDLQRRDLFLLASSNK